MGLGFMINTNTAPTDGALAALPRSTSGVILMQLQPFADPKVLQTLIEFETGFSCLGLVVGVPGAGRGLICACTPCAETGRTGVSGRAWAA
ncbi:hypothetical protein AC629_20535 [Bradyrhizobium sp. NAS80.1]|nr:hypothetical protein AC629_20535 [Bradyrhizobium sp. NAS80.1]